ncbi:hypothetical protein F4819DRAFT_448214 [Hypoxylon fuscum]|nr:hypothetical protein F4819DRAFT_448214 [Hypoxylon fuscum]
MTSPIPFEMSDNPPSDPETSGPTIASFLESCQFENGPYIHPRVISFHTDQDRVNWSSFMPDWQSRDTFSQFASSALHGKSTKIGVFSVPTGSQIGNEWKDAVWHVFVVAIIHGKPKKRVLIWDCDPQEDAASRRWSNVLRGRQRTFIEYLRDKRNLRPEIWYHTDTTYSGQDKSLLFSLQKVKEWALLGDFAYQGEDDPRFVHCVPLRL